METKIFAPRIDWWVYAIIPFTIFCCMLGPILTGSDYLIGFLLSVPICILFCFLVFTFKYAIRGNEFGFKCYCRWCWFPIDKIESIVSINSILSAAALSRQRIGIKFTDRKILKSFAPLEISPRDRDGFIAELLKINPSIKVLLTDGK